MGNLLARKCHWKQVRHSDQPHVAGSPSTLLNACWRTLCHDSNRDTRQDQLRRATAGDQWVHDGIPRYGRSEGEQSQCPDFQRYVYKMNYRSTTSHYCFRSKSRCIGLVPSRTVVGDRLYVLSGDDDHEFSFLGDAYVFGLMEWTEKVCIWSKMGSSI